MQLPDSVDYEIYLKLFTLDFDEDFGLILLLIELRRTQIWLKSHSLLKVGFGKLKMFPSLVFK